MTKVSSSTLARSVLVAATAITATSTADDPDPNSCWRTYNAGTCCALLQSTMPSTEDCDDELCWVDVFSDGDVWLAEEVTSGGMTWTKLELTHYGAIEHCGYVDIDCVLISNSPLTGPEYGCVAMTIVIAECPTIRTREGLPPDASHQAEHQDC